MMRNLVIGLMLCIASVCKAQGVTSIQPDFDPGLGIHAPMVSEYPADSVPVYFTWMMDLAKCESLNLPPFPDFKAFKFYEVNATDFMINQDTTKQFLAVTVAGAKVVYVSIAHVYDRALMLHEFLHILLYYNFPDLRYTGDDNKQNHPVKYFHTCGVDNYYNGNRYGQ